MPKKDKANLNLNFNELGSMERSIEESYKNKVIKKKPPPKRKKSLGDIVLSIPIEGNPSKFKSITISECTGQEFIKWSKNVAHPIKQSDTQHFNIEANRINKFKQIVTYHNKNFVLSNPEGSGTYH
jgi:hypothetical protein